LGDAAEFGRGLGRKEVHPTVDDMHRLSAPAIAGETRGKVSMRRPNERFDRLQIAMVHAARLAGSERSCPGVQPEATWKDGPVSEGD
jgi:hypothetical protein